MSLLHDALYLVEPLPALAERLRQEDDPDLADILLEPRLFRQRESDKSGWLNADGEAATKLLYLASLRQYTPLQEAAEFAALFGSNSISLSVFDRWFRVRRFVVDDELESLIAGLRECPLVVEPSGRFAVDQWLSAVRGEAEPKAPPDCGGIT